MFVRALIPAITLILMSTTVLAWDVGQVSYNVTNNEMTIQYSFSPFEFLYSFFIGGGEYIKSITAEFITGNYTVVEAGYSTVKISVDGNISFSHPVNIYIQEMNESHLIVNVTAFSPE